MEKEYSIGLNDINSSNLFLRCLWALMRERFGKLAWQTFNLRIPNSTTIDVGCANVYDSVTYHVSLEYKRKGCLKCIVFNDVPEADANKLDKCVKDALQYDKFIKKRYFKVKLDDSLHFEKALGTNFCIDGNEITMQIHGFDHVDCEFLIKIFLPIICDILSFYTMRYVSYGEPIIRDLRASHNTEISLVDADTDEVVSTCSPSDRQRNIKVQEDAVKSIDDCLCRNLRYDNHRNRFESSAGLYAQGLFYDEISMRTGSQEFPYLENAIVAFMSALEIISAEDAKPETCKTCGQLRYSIAKRVRDLVSSAMASGDENIADYMQKWTNNYYAKRSKYVHEGKYLSARSYSGVSLPLLSKSSQSGLMEQNTIVPEDLKEIVRECIIWHEANRIAPLLSHH